MGGEKNERRKQEEKVGTGSAEKTDQLQLCIYPFCSQLHDVSLYLILQKHKVHSLVELKVTQRSNREKLKIGLEKEAIVLFER